MSQIKKIVDKILGSSDKHSGEYLYFCPKCNHKKKKLSINFEKDKFQCWVCEYAGKSIYNLIRRFGAYEDIKEYCSYSDTVSLSSVYNLFFSKDQEEKRVVTTCSLPDEYEFILYSKTKLADKAINYLINRGLNESDFYKWKIGICESGNYACRIIFPSFNSIGNCNFFVARGFLEDTKYTYLYSKVEKTKVIFNEINIDWDNPIYITEGLFDAMKFGKNAIPLLGKTIPVDDNGYSKLLEKLIVYQPKIYLCLDSDLVKGSIVNRSISVANQLMSYSISNVEIIDPSPYKDFGDIPKEKISQFISHKTNVTSKFDLIKKQIDLLGLA